MALSLGTQEFKEAGPLENGTYHLRIDTIAQEYGALKVGMTVLAGTKPEMAGRKLSEMFNLEGKALNRLYVLAMACGIVPIGDAAPLNPKRLEQLKASGQNCDIDEQHFIGRSFIGTSELKPYQGKKEELAGKSFPNLDFRIYSVWKSQELACPLDQANAQYMAGLVPKPASMTPPPPAAPPAAPVAPAAPTAPAPAASDFFK